MDLRHRIGVINQAHLSLPRIQKGVSIGYKDLCGHCFSGIQEQLFTGASVARESGSAMGYLAFLSAVLLLLPSVSVAGEVCLTDPVLLNKGVKIVGVNGSAYQSFLGIPYAEPPINELRFAVSTRNVKYDERLFIFPGFQS